MESKSLVMLNRQRGVIKTKITKLSKFVETFQVGEADQSVLLKTKLDSMLDIKMNLNSLLQEFLNLPEDIDIQESLSTIEMMEDELEQTEVRFKILLSELEKSVDVSKVESTSKPIKIKLPEMPLPQFWGKYEEFQNFKIQFMSLIGENKDLNENQKLFYLKASLKGEAKSIETYEDTFDSLVSALTLRYQDERAVVDAHINSLLNYARVNGSPSQLRHLLDNTKRNLRALSVLEYNRSNLSDILILNILLQKLDKESRNQYELTLKSNNVPLLDDFLKFLEERTRILEGLMKSDKSLLKNDYNTKIPMKTNSNRSRSLLVKSNTNSQCLVCKESHGIYRCLKFKELNVSERFDLAKKHKLCLKCLNSNSHLLSQCRSKYRCSLCGSVNHHYLLCKNSSEEGKVETSVDCSPQIEKTETRDILSTSPRSALIAAGENKYVLINTAIVYIRDSQNKKRPLRAILDSAAQSSFITTESANALGLRKEKICIPITGLNDCSLNIKSQTRAQLSDINDKFKWNIELLVVPKITDITPSKHLDISALKIPRGISLADPGFYFPKKIDILLGAELFFQFLKTDRLRLEDNELILQDSCFGYLVSGSTQNSSANMPNHCFLSKNLESLDNILTSFWEIENVEEHKPQISKELLYCNEHYENTHYRKRDGKYVVKMPFKPEITETLDMSLGESKSTASKRLNQLWHRLEHDPAMKVQYSEFLHEYKHLNHMEEVTGNEDSDEGYFLPHHGVLRPSSRTTKLRVVFDASAKTTNGKSLNNLLCKGGSIQDELFSIMIRFRKHIYAFTADIEKMFRQIEINPSQTNLQKILWKEGKTEPIQIFRLKTVTYGTACAPYLATRTLHQLARDEERDFPRASKIVLEDFYMDDCLSGSSNLEEFKLLQIELTNLLLRGGMTLHKWCSNYYLQDIKSQDFSFDRNNEEITVKTLGMLWKSGNDTFTYKVSITPGPSITKRDVLSQIARIFDPLGLIGPVISKAKIFMQRLWLLKLEWHEELPQSSLKEWGAFIRTLPCIESIQVPRCVMILNAKQIIIHGFADSSERAFGAVLYLQVISELKEFNCSLLCSKSRVAPIKTMTIPRLELSACLLLAQLVTKVLPALKLNVSSVHLWTDSTIVLSWIKTAPHLLKTFVSNRVSQIQQLSKDYEWRHVSSDNNPADLISRGIDGETLLNNKLWWNGPEFLKQFHGEISPSENESNVTDEVYLSELKTLASSNLTLTSDSNIFDDLINNSNNFHKVIRVLSFVQRFIYNVRHPRSKVIGPLTTEEHNKAHDVLIRHVQIKYFSNEITALRKGLSVSPKSKLRFFNCFLDKNGLIRVGGRLTNSQLSYESKHPIVLPGGNKLTKSVFEFYHKRDLHVGPQALLNTVRQTYWPLNGRNIARQVVHNCIQCFKVKPITEGQIMGELPPERVRPIPPFFNVGLDFCGPFQIKYRYQRKGIYHKVYVAIFVCFATKAVHFELVTDLTSDALIAALKRFFARRGKSSTIFSDNATNFSGAYSELNRLLNLVKKSNNDISSFLVSEGVNWKFLPPRAPNFGGLWEAGVKSFKYHLKRTIGTTKLTFEEFLTVVIQIEGILNSRPLSPLSSDFDDYEVLTPGHFLVGKPINAVVEPDLTNTKENLLDRWQKTQRIVQVIWRRWQHSYLSHLQQRTKWFFEKQNVAPGMMVLVKDNSPLVCKWSIGRITEIIPGADGKVRVVKVRTPRGEFKRAVSCVSVLPIVDNYG